MTIVRCTFAQEIIVTVAAIPSRITSAVVRHFFQRGGGLVVCIGCYGFECGVLTRAPPREFSTSGGANETNQRAPFSNTCTARTVIGWRSACVPSTALIPAE